MSAADVLGLQQQLKGLQIEQILGTQAQLSVADPQAAMSKCVCCHLLFIFCYGNTTFETGFSPDVPSESVMISDFITIGLFQETFGEYR